jgi:hypothetical protein
VSSSGRILREYYWWAQKDSMIILRGGRHPPLSLPCVFSVDGPSIFIQIFQIFHFKETLKISDLIKKKTLDTNI